MIADRGIFLLVLVVALFAIQLPVSSRPLASYYYEQLQRQAALDDGDLRGAEATSGATIDEKSAAAATMTSSTPFYGRPIVAITSMPPRPLFLNGGLCVPCKIAFRLFDIVIGLELFTQRSAERMCVAFTVC